MLLSNIDVAILTKLNQLTERHGLKAYEFTATLKKGPEGQGILAFETPVYGDALKEKRFLKMLQDLGVNEDGLLQGGESAVIDGLDHALQLSPKQHLRL